MNNHPFFLELSLAATPQISERQDMILQVHSTVNEVKEQNKTNTVAGEKQVLPLAFSTVRESDNIVKAKMAKWWLSAA